MNSGKRPSAAPQGRRSAGAATDAASRAPRPAPPPVTLEDLRPLLVGPEQSRIQRIEERLDSEWTDMVADSLPDAVVKSRAKGDGLGWALGPVIDTSVREAMKKDPSAFAEVLSPAMGPAVRRAVAERLRALIEQFNEALERSLTLRSIRWRIEARRTGRPFAEVVLLRTLLYRTEQLFLIHRGTGLLLDYITAAGVPDKDPDQVSAMLSALDSFAHEAFREDARLERFRIGELTGWVEHGPSALLVAIVRGTAPEDYEGVLREALDRTHLEYGPELLEFRGDPEPFARVRETLSACLHDRRVEPRRRWLGPLLIGIAAAALVALVTGFGWQHASRERQRFAAYVTALEREPGLVVTSAEQRAPRHLIRGLRDPLAADPASALSRRGLDPARASFAFEPFYSLDPRIVERRAAEALRPPGGVSLALRGGTLEARGVAPERWIDRARSMAAALPGVAAFEEHLLYSEESVAAARAAAGALDATELLFPPGSARLPAGQRARLDAIAARARQLVEAAQRGGMAARFEVIGYADPSGPGERNQALSAARAEHAAAELQARGIVASARGGGVRPDVESRRARSVVLRVELSPAGEG
ncbi:MAG: OmpA family protein [Polyangiaceae bacterium]|nr:OmpA family protein [Polyangiaceae bacterium]